jgi:hypothetical protein
MKYKVGDKVRFVKDCALDNSVIHAESVWEVSDISKEHYILVCVEKEHLLAVIDCESVDNSSELWEEKQMPKFKPKTKIVFTEDYRVAFGCVRKNTKGEVLGIEKIGDDDFYYSIAIGDERKKAHIPVENMDKVCVEDKTQNKHNILNELTIIDAIKPNYYQYRGGDVFDMAAHFQLNFPLGNALKYLLRAGHKDPARKIEDLRKCIQCIQRAIEIEGEKHE